MSCIGYIVRRSTCHVCWRSKISITNADCTCILIAGFSDHHSITTNFDWCLVAVLWQKKMCTEQSTTISQRRLYFGPLSDNFTIIPIMRSSFSSWLGVALFLGKYEKCSKSSSMQHELRPALFNSLNARCTVAL